MDCSEGADAWLRVITDRLVVVCNVGDAAAAVPLPDDVGELLLTSSRSLDTATGRLTLPAQTVAIFRRRGTLERTLEEASNRQDTSPDAEILSPS